ncbi:MAG: methionine adenosyltransferase domain-containing protein, partial [Muribaculaceae bacterium]|nr:methionine adenosyltransferase domain-containing protein [Muribaculaceae bacterium]
SQGTLDYYSDTRRPVRVHTFVVSTQHDEFLQPTPGQQQAAVDEAMLARIKSDVETILLPRVIAQLPADVQALFDSDLILHVNPTGKFVIGGPHGDTGLTGRKIIVDTYGGRGAHGGGAFSGKDPSKVDRSAAYAARHIAKNAVAAGIADEMLVQVAYAIGVAKPVSFFVNTYGTSHVQLTDEQIANVLSQVFDMRPAAIEKRLKLRNPIYEETAAYGHMGREPQVVTKHFHSPYEQDCELKVELFTWEKLDYVQQVRDAFHL